MQSAVSVMARRRILCPAILFSFIVAVCPQNAFYHTKSQWNVLSAYKTGTVTLLQGLQLKPHQNKPNRSQPRGRRHSAARIPYYVNSDTSFNIARLAISGDVEPHPGPGSGNDTNCCPVCKKKVFWNHRATICDVCHKWCHIKCGRVTPESTEKCRTLSISTGLVLSALI